MNRVTPQHWGTRFCEQPPSSGTDLNVENDYGVRPHYNLDRIFLLFFSTAYSATNRILDVKWNNYAHMLCHYPYFKRSSPHPNNEPSAGRGSCQYGSFEHTNTHSTRLCAALCPVAGRTNAPRARQRSRTNNPFHGAVGILRPPVGHGRTRNA